MLMDLFSFGVGTFFGTIIGIGIMAMMITSKQADEQIEGVMCPFVFDKDICNKECEKFEACRRKHFKERLEKRRGY